jgi:alkylhydroperoxidase family enzyme
MAYLQGTKDHGGDEELKSAFELAAQLGWVHDGKPNNLMEVMSSRPGLITGLGQLTGSIFSGEVPATVKVMVWYTIAERSNCRYCTVANRKTLQQMGVADDVIKSCAQDPDLSALPPAQRSIVAFGVKAAKYPQKMTDEDYAVLREQGLSDGEILEITMLAAFAVMLDVFADAVGVHVDGE